MRTLATVLFLTASALSAQSPTARLEISLPKTSFYLGEVIPLQLAFTSSEPNVSANGRLQDRAGRINGTDEFHVDPASGVVDPLEGLLAARSGMGGLGGIAKLSDKPFLIERTLNEWIRFLRPGQYSIYVTSHRVAGVVLSSNILSFQIAAAPDAWVKQQIDDAEAVLGGPTAATDESRRARIAAANKLAFLGTREAATALVRHLSPSNSADEYVQHLAILGSPYRKDLIPLLEARISAPGQAVEWRYLDTIARLANLVDPSVPYEQQLDRYRAALAQALSHKLPDAAGSCAQTLLEAGRNSTPAPAWLPAVRAYSVANFLKLPAETQNALLAGDWEALKSPEMLPILRSIYVQPEAKTGPPVDDIALQRIVDLDPAEGRALVLAEIQQRTHPRIEWTTLAKLPDATISDLDETLAEHYAASEYDQQLLPRYADGAIASRIQQAYQARVITFAAPHHPECFSPVVFYLLKYDPPYGESVAQRIFANPPAYPNCQNLGANTREYGAYIMSPALEKLAIEHLVSTSVPVKDGAAALLGRFGSPAAKQPLWDAMAYFRDWWKDREIELKDQRNFEGQQFERTLRIALAQGPWDFSDGDYARLVSLCSSDWCRSEVTQWRQQGRR